MNSIQEFWKLLLEHFEKTNSEFTFNHWIKPAEPIRIEQNILYIKVPSKTFARYWQDNLIRDIMEIGYDYFRQSFGAHLWDKEDARLTGIVSTL